MNAGRDLMKRLLHLFPVQSIKEEFQLTGNAEDIIDYITGKETQARIKQFAFTRYALTKQKVYLFELNSNFVKRNFDPSTFPFTVENDKIESGSFIFQLLPKTIYSVYLSNPIDSNEIHFLHPVTVKVYNNKLIIHFTKLVKNISHYFPEDRLAKTAKQENTEEEILSGIASFFSSYNPQPLDINRGVKQLWNVDDVDSYKINSRKSFSSVMEVMNGTMTYKQKYPAEYQELIQRPLVKTVFKYLLKDDYLCGEFTVDPENGQISINQFSNDLTQVNNVISKILTNN